MNKEIETRAEALRQTAALLRQMEEAIAEMTEALGVIDIRLRSLVGLLIEWAKAEDDR